MANDGRDLCIQRKRSREEMEKNEEEMEFIILLEGFLSMLIGVWYYRKYMVKEPSRSEIDKRIHHRRLWMQSLSCESICIEQLRITTQGFEKLCNILRDEGELVATRNVTIREIVALFLHILAHNLKNSTIKAMFARFGETISRQFHTVLRAVTKIGRKYMKQDLSVLDQGEDNRWKWFKGALGALDGTHVPLTVPMEDKGRYRNRKGELSTNVLGVCKANLKFSYVLPGWEGSSSDSRVLRDALNRHHCLKVPSNRYFLVDSGDTNGPGFLAPYRGTRYHLNLWRGTTPTNYKELFNLRHSSARNTIKRAFGLLKKRWAILRTAGFYSVKTQIRVINACCILHSFIRDEMKEDDMLRDVDQELANVLPHENEVVDENITSVRVTGEWTTFRDTLAMQMFEEYQNQRGHDV